MRRVSLIVLVAAAWARADTMPLYYDYLEDGQLTGGRILIDLDDPDDRARFGLDDVGPRGTWTVTTILDNGPPENRVDLVMLGDGYTDGELGAYAGHVDAVLLDFFAEHPLAAYTSYFNVHRVDVVSNESGVDEPASGIFRDTALDMAYDCGGIARLLCINVGKANGAAASAPAVDQVLALANSTRYGGAGYTDLCTLAGNSSAAVELALHEFGHAFADLADEYDYADGATYTGPEPGDANVSIHDAATQIALQTKWHLWMDLPQVDTFEGAMYHQFGIYRPTVNSKMRSLNRPYEEINVEQFILSIYKEVSPIDDATPASVDPLSACTTFSVAPMEPVDHALAIQWSVDGAAVAGATGTTFTADAGALAPGVHIVAVTVSDPTGDVRDESARALWMTDSRQWEIAVTTGSGGCDVGAPLAAAYPHDRRKNRYISFDPNNAGNGGLEVAFKVELKQLTLGSCDGNGGFCRADRGADDCKVCSAVGNPCISPPIDCAPSPPQTCDSTGQTCINDAPDVGGTNTGRTWWVGPGSPLGNGVHLLVSEPFRISRADWPVPTHVGDCEVVPQAVYGVRAVNVAGGGESDELLVETTFYAPISASWWADCVGPLVRFCDGDIRTAPCASNADCTAPATCDFAWTLPDGAVNVDDITAALVAVAPAPSSVLPHRTWIDLYGNASGATGSEAFDPPDYVANVSDISQVVFGFQGRPYTFFDPADCPDVPDWP